MTTLSVDKNNDIIAHDATPAAQDNVVASATEKEFTKLCADWPIARFAEVWNSFAGVPPFSDLKPIKKFADRPTATARIIWKAIQTLTLTEFAPLSPGQANVRDTDRLLRALSPKHEKVIRLRFGLGCMRGHIREEIGQEFDLTAGRIRQTEVQALRKLGAEFSAAAAAYPAHFPRLESATAAPQAAPRRAGESQGAQGGHTRP